MLILLGAVMLAQSTVAGQDPNLHTAEEIPAVSEIMLFDSRSGD